MQYFRIMMELCVLPHSLTLNKSLPEDLHNILGDISKSIPVCIVSSKDFSFLEPCSNFAVIISSIMGIETFFLQKNNKDFNNGFVTYETTSDLIEKDKFKSHTLAQILD